MKLTSKRTENGFTFTVQLINTGETFDIYFSPKCNRHTAYEFLKRVLKPYSAERLPKILNTDRLASNGYAIARIMKKGKLR